MRLVLYWGCIRRCACQPHEHGRYASTTCMLAADVLTESLTTRSLSSFGGTDDLHACSRCTDRITHKRLAFFISWYRMHLQSVRGPHLIEGAEGKSIVNIAAGCYHTVLVASTGMLYGECMCNLSADTHDMAQSATASALMLFHLCGGLRV